ncbi:unnamed protein product [Cylindrotheca closterium]|uniref:Uncharacterized protein n=1 Tax=Cylindrotheca closterium TaxID=2856 RepID=A0AAD2G811_9STRA|nr:unnamed protein product [Cylindrotheca closterium]
MEEKKKKFMEDLKKNLKKKADEVSIFEEKLDRIWHKYNMPIFAIEDGGFLQYAQYEDHPQEDPCHKILKSPKCQIINSVAVMRASTL